MNEVSSLNPLFLPVLYNRQTYFTSHYFHQQYQANKPEGGKYAQLSHFNRLIRSLEAYQDYLGRSDIVELTWEFVKNQGDPIFGLLKSLVEGNSYKPIMLINATAQIALTHHLDDEISKQVSVEVNAGAARRTSSLASLEDSLLFANFAFGTLRYSEASKLKALGSLGQHYGVPVARLLPDYVEEGLARSLSSLLKEHGVKWSAVKVNPALQALGYLEQLSRPSSTKGEVRTFWSVTGAGERYGKNVVSPHNERETQPLWYVDQFSDLLEQLEKHFGLKKVLSK